MESTRALNQLVREAREEMTRRVGRPPHYVVAAPGRVNLIGEHTDYNDGFVLPMAIARYVVIAADRPTAGVATSGGGTARVYSTALQEWATIPLDGTERVEPEWARYVQGVVVGLRAAGLDSGPFEAVIHSDLPPGSGLSSSAALEVATATLVEALTGTSLDPLRKALLCQKAEHDYAGVPCGIMDPLASVFGKAGALLLLDCRSRIVELTPLEDPEVVALIVNSNVKHALTDGGYAARRQQCEEAARLLGVPALRDVERHQLEQDHDRLSDIQYRRARHVVTEIARTREAAQAVRRRDWQMLGSLMYASHASLRDDFQVSCSELDLLVELAAAAGSQAVIGARMTGGGFGGCTISLVYRAAVPKLVEDIQHGYHRATGLDPTVFVTRPVDGAHVVSAPTFTAGS